MQFVVVVVVVVVVVIEALQYVFILCKILCGLFFLQELPVRKLVFIVVVVVVVVNLISHAGYLFLPLVLETLWNSSETAIFLALGRIRRSFHFHVSFA